MHGETYRPNVEESMWWRHRWSWAVLSGLVLGGVTAAGMWMIFEPQYRAEAWLKLEDRRQFIVFPDQSGSQARTQVDLIRSPVVLGKLLSDPEVAQMPEIKAQVEQVEWLKDRVQVATGGSELFQIRFEGPDPENAAKIVNKIVDVYLKLHEGENRVQSDGTINELERLRMMRERELVRIQEEYRTLAKQAAGKDFTDPNQIVSQVQAKYQIVQDKLAETEMERRILEATLAAKERELSSGSTPAVLAINRAGDTLNTAQDIALGGVSSVRDQLRDYSKSAGQLEGGPKAKDLMSKTVALELALAGLEDQLRSEREANVEKKTAAERQKEIASLRADIARKLLLEVAYGHRLKAEQESLQRFSSVSLDLQFKRRDLERETAVHQKIADRVTALKTEKSAPSQVSLLQDATPPVEPIDAIPDFGLLVLAATGGFLLPLLAVSIWTTRRQEADQRAIEADEAEAQEQQSQHHEPGVTEYEDEVEALEGERPEEWR